MPEYKPITAPIVRWMPKHDQTVALYIAGYGTDAIANVMRLSKVTIANTIKDPRAQKVIEIARKRTFTSIMTACGDKMTALGVRAVDNIAETINSDIRDSEGEVAIGTKAKIHQDNVSFELLGRIGFGRGSQQEDSGGLRLSPETEKKLVEGVERARKAEIIFRKTEEVEFRDVTSEKGNGKRTGTDS